MKLDKFINFNIVPKFGMSDKKINIKITKSKIDGILGISEIATVLKGIQDAIYHIAEFKNVESIFDKNKNYRIAGSRNSLIEKRVILTFEKCKAGSFEAEIIGESQETLHGKAIVDEAIDIFGNLAFDLNEVKDNLEGKISSIISDSRYESRIINSISEFWPGDENRYEIFLETSNFRKNYLKADRRKIIRQIALKEQKLKEESAFGILAGGHLIGGKRKFELIMQDGKKIECKFKPELHEIVYNLMTKPVVVRGIFTTSAGKLNDMVDVMSVDIFNSITKNSIISESGELKLNKNIKIDISFDRDEELWIFIFPELNLFSYGETYDEAMNDFQEDFYELYEHYVHGNPQKMKGNALKIREYLINITS